MTRVRLEINQLNIDRPKKRWKIYFVIVAEHPTDPDKMVVTTIPNSPIRFTPNLNNEFHFTDNTPGSEGLLVLRREMPVNRDLNVHCYIRHSRSDVRDAGDILTDIKTGIGADVIDIASDILGTTNPWLVIAKTALPLIGKVLADVQDREMGFISMYERFGSEFEQNEEIDREKTGGFSTVVYTWAVDRE